MIPLQFPASARSAWRLLYVLGFISLGVLVTTPKGSLAGRENRRPSRKSSLHWYRGNTHTHSNNSFDGESSPLAVATVYKNLGYNFLFFTDHNKLTTVDAVNAEVGVPGQ